MSIFDSQPSSYSPQVNISIFINVDKAILNQSLEGCIFMMDDSPDSVGEGSAHLESYCELGQMVNWSIYPIEANQIHDKHNAPSVSLEHIQFDNSQIAILKNPSLGNRHNREASHNIHPHSGCLAADLLAEGHYHYRLQVKIQPQNSAEAPMFFDMSSASLLVDKPKNIKAA